MADPTPPPSWHPAPRAPRVAFPDGACDAHVHVFGPRSRFAFAPGRSYTPADAPKEALYAMHARLGVSRCVVVQSNAHGYDNAASEDAIAAKRGAYAGIALVPLAVADAELERLDRAGFRGARFHYFPGMGEGGTIGEVVAFAGRLVRLGWHLQIHCESSRLVELAPALRRSPVPVVVDHMARIDASLGLDQPAFRTLRSLMEDARFWVKVSGSERVSRRGPPYADAVPFARTLVADAGDRVLWGTDWPHPNLDHVPDDGALADLVEPIAPSAAARQALLVDNPQRLYRFAATP